MKKVRKIRFLMDDKTSCEFGKALDWGPFMNDVEKEAVNILETVKSKQFLAIKRGDNHVLVISTEHIIGAVIDFEEVEDDDM